MLGLEQRFQIKNGPSKLAFIGWELANADSCTSGHESRWTELNLYRTTSGRYVLQRIGRSDVFHNERCTPNSKWTRYDYLELAMPDDVEPDDEIEVVFVQCDECRPEYTDQPVWVERDIYQASHFDTAEQLLEALYRPDTKNSTKYLSRVARSLLEQAVQKDAEIRRVMTEPVDVT